VLPPFAAAAPDAIAAFSWARISHLGEVHRTSLPVWVKSGGNSGPHLDPSGVIMTNPLREREAVHTATWLHFRKNNIYLKFGRKRLDYITGSRSFENCISAFRKYSAIVVRTRTSGSTTRIVKRVGSPRLSGMIVKRDQVPRVPRTTAKQRASSCPHCSSHWVLTSAATVSRG
jgi:hypothetical protein